MLKSNLCQQNEHTSQVKPKDAENSASGRSLKKGPSLAKSSRGKGPKVGKESQACKLSS
jgi:hypothetical protein